MAEFEPPPSADTEAAAAAPMMLPKLELFVELLLSWLEVDKFLPEFSFWFNDRLPEPPLPGVPIV